MTSLLLKPFEQRLGAGDIMHLTGGDQEADREAIPIDPRMDLRGEAIERSIICTSPSVVRLDDGIHHTIPDARFAPTVETIAGGV
jgi:hypothetical protein